jgi:hypothetical protein
VIPRRLTSLVILLALPGAFTCGAESTLFHTPAERARVTEERAAMLATESAGGDVQLIQSIAPANAALVPAGPPRLEGVSLPKDGRAHAWIGGRRYQDGELYQGQRVRVLRNGVQLVGPGGQGRLYRVGEAMRAARQ